MTTKSSGVGAGPVLRWLDRGVVVPDVAAAYPNLSEQTVRGLNTYCARFWPVPAQEKVLPKVPPAWQGYLEYLRSTAYLGGGEIRLVEPGNPLDTVVRPEDQPIFFKTKAVGREDPNNKRHFRMALDRMNLGNFSPPWAPTVGDFISLYGDELPCVIKPTDMASGVDISFADSATQLPSLEGSVVVEANIREEMAYEGSIQLIVLEDETVILGTTRQMIGRDQKTHMGNALWGDELSCCETAMVHQVANWNRRCGCFGYASLDYGRMKDGRMILFEENARMGGVTHVWAILEQIQMQTGQRPTILAVNSVIPKGSAAGISNWKDLQDFLGEDLYSSQKRIGCLPMMPMLMPHKIGMTFVARDRTQVVEMADRVLGQFGETELLDSLV